MFLSPRRAILALTALLALCTAGCLTGSGDSAASVDPAVPVASEPTANTAEDDAEYAPEFTLNDLSGAPVSLADSAGRVRLIDFWATWCPPCRDEIPMLNELEQSYGSLGLTILAISDESTDVLQEFAASNKMAYTSLVGTERVAMKYGVLGLPTAYLLDQEGRVVESFFGPKPRKVLEGKIRELLDLAPAT